MISSEDISNYVKKKTDEIIWSKQKIEFSDALKNRNPIMEAIEASKPPPLEEEANDVRDGLLLIFHGSPFSGKLFLST